MASTDEVKKLASLARLSFDDAAIEAYAKDFENIIGYVSKLSELDIKTSSGNTVGAVHNAFRDDVNPHLKSTNTEVIVEQFPKKKNGYLSVKKIISYD